MMIAVSIGSPLAELAVAYSSMSRTTKGPVAPAASRAARSTPVWPPERIFTMQAINAPKEMQIEAKSLG
jgi:hypothetical protein